MAGKRGSSHKTLAAGSEKRSAGLGMRTETVADLKWSLASTQGLNYGAPQRGAGWKPGSQSY